MADDIVDWHWCGFPHHFIGGKDCHYHLATFVAGGRYLISTVGDYRPKGYDCAPVTLGADALSFYETMVFASDPSVCTDGCPTVTDYTELDGQRSTTADEAARTHIAYCHEWEARRG